MSGLVLLLWLRTGDKQMREVSNYKHNMNICGLPLQTGKMWSECPVLPLLSSPPSPAQPVLWPDLRVTESRLQCWLALAVSSVNVSVRESEETFLYLNVIPFTNYWNWTLWERKITRIREYQNCFILSEAALVGVDIILFR